MLFNISPWLVQMGHFVACKVLLIASSHSVVHFFHSTDIPEKAFSH